MTLGYVLFLDAEQHQLLEQLVQEELEAIEEAIDVTDPDMVEYLADLNDLAVQVSDAADTGTDD